MSNVLRRFAESKWFDLVGVVLVVGIAISSGYLATRLDTFVHWGSWTSYVPFGLISVINVGISMLSTRFTGRLSRFGNYLGIINTVLSGVIDYILGNKSAIITYPVTFLIYTYAINRWSVSRDGVPNRLSVKQTRVWLSVLIPLAVVFSFVTNYIGYQGNLGLLGIITTVVFALSLIANVLNALKVTTQWEYWLVYNIVQLVKSLVQGNFANLGKYIFYVVNSLGALVFWRGEDRS